MVGKSLPRAGLEPGTAMIEPYRNFGLSECSRVVKNI